MTKYSEQNRDAFPVRLTVDLEAGESRERSDCIWLLVPSISRCTSYEVFSLGRNDDVDKRRETVGT